MTWHYLNEYEDTACGRRYNVWTMVGTTDQTKVTCKRCLKALAKVEKEGEK